MSDPYKAYGVWARHPELHTSPDIGWSLCDGCKELTVTPRDWAKHERYTYHCNALHKNLKVKDIYEMRTKDCPIGREVKRRRR